MESIRESLNAKIESFKNITDGRLNTHHKKITYLWTGLLEQDFPWIKHEYLLNDSNYSSQIDHLIDDLTTLKIDLDEFQRSTFNLSTEKLSIKLEPIDSNFKKVKILKYLKSIFIEIAINFKSAILFHAYHSGYIDGQA